MHVSLNYGDNCCRLLSRIMLLYAWATCGNGFQHFMVNFSNCPHVEFPILNILTLSTVCFLRVPWLGCSKLG